MADRRVSVSVDANVSPFVRGMGQAAAAAKAFSSNLDGTETRLSGIIQTAMALTPALVPIGSLGVPAIAGLTSQLGAAVGAAGVAALAFSGVGDALEAVNKYQLEPTTENFNEMQVALEELGPAGADFVRFLSSVRPEIDALQNAAREGLFPGLEEGIRELLVLAPEFREIVSGVAESMGRLAAEAGDNLNDPRWREFFDYLDREAGPTLEIMGRTFGNFVEGVANMLMALDPMADDFNQWLLGMSRSFRDWSDDLAGSNGLREFIDHVRDVGPQVGETFGAIVNALAEIVKAAAPVGRVVLPAVEAIANALAAVAGSPAGPVLVGAAAGLGALSRAVALYNAANGSAIVGMLGRAGKDGRAAGLGFRHAAAGAGMLVASMTDLDDKAGVSNTVMGGLMGMMAGPWGAAAGAAAGATMDLVAANDDLAASLERAHDVARNSNSVEELRSQLAAIKREAEGFDGLDDIFGVEDRKVADATRDLNQRIREIEGGAGGLARVLGGPLAEGLGTTAKEFDTAAMSAREFRAAVDQVNAILDRRASLRAYRDSIREFTEVMKNAPENMRRGSQAYDEVEGALDNIARNALTAAEQLKGMNRIRFLDNARDDFIKAAQDMGMTERQARRLADRLGLLDRIDPKVKVDEEGSDKTKNKINDVKEAADRLDRTKPKPTLDVNDKPARSKTNDAQREVNIFDGMNAWANLFANGNQARNEIASVRALLRGIDGTVARTFVETIYRGRNPSTPGPWRDGYVSADGSTVPKDGGPYADRYPYLLAPGEEVISNRNGQADRWRPLLKAINDNRLADGGTVRGLANGGTASVGDRVGRVMRQFDLEGGQSVKRVNREFSRLEKAAGGLGKRFDRLEKRAEGVAREYNEQRRQMRSLRDKMADTRSAARDSFNNDIFGNDLAGLRLQLQADKNDANSMRRALDRAGNRGLDGPLAAAIAGSGDLNTARQISQLSRRQIAELERLYADRSEAQRQLGDVAGRVSYGQDMARVNRTLTRLDRTLNRIEQSVERGARRGVAEQARKANQRRKAGKR